jgi:cyclophilin family peptidyl-prolyl cis-trans isomerase
MTCFRCTALIHCTALRCILYAPTGDPTGTGKGGKSIYATPNGKFPDEISDALKHSKRGVVSMANSGPNTNGSQFFVMYKAQAHLNGKYTVFGQVRVVACICWFGDAFC